MKNLFVVILLGVFFLVGIMPVGYAAVIRNTAPWMNNIIWQGDIRLRYEHETNDPGMDTNRQRLRFRYGFETKVNDQFKVGARIASGSDASPTSTNQTLAREFRKKDLWLDLAYVDYTPNESMNIKGGKFKNPFFCTDMVWDTDVTFDGAVMNIVSGESKDYGEYVLVFGMFAIDDAERNDPWLGAVQLQTKTKTDEGINMDAGITYYGFNRIKGYIPVEGKGTNTLSGGVYPKNFQLINPTLVIDFGKTLGGEVPMGIITDYIYNTEASVKKEAGRIGAWVGKKVLEEKDDWKFIFQYSDVERDALLDIFPDADFNNGGTNAKGYELIFDYALQKNVVFTVDYYCTETEAGSKSDEEVIQVDLVVKF
ncbi:MAG: putative porin [Candidatus Omnitrophota bacterium]